MPETALVVVVPEAERVVGRWRAAHDPSAARGMPAHVTVLYPFLHEEALGAAAATRLADAVATVPAFGARFPRTGSFGDGSLWLAPEPDEAFRSLTRAVCAAFPSHPPYGGAFAEVVPHLTVADGASAEAAAAIGRRLSSRRIDAETRVTGVTLFVLREGRWTPLRRFPLKP